VARGAGGAGVGEEDVERSGLEEAGFHCWRWAALGGRFGLPAAVGAVSVGACRLDGVRRR
jgi:hypothetical protein